jgi:hypothetical protein
LSEDDSKPRAFRQVPTVQPDQWEDFPAFRETFLADAVDDSEDNQALRVLGRLLFDGLLANRASWPYSPIGATADNLRAVLADLRYLQGFLAYACHREEIDREDDEDEAKRHDALCRIGARLRKRIGALADDLEKEVGLGSSNSAAGRR